MQYTASFSALRRLREGSFRIVWFGNIIRHATADCVVVVFAPFKVAPSTGEEQCDLSKRISVTLPIAYLRKFRIGDVWEDGMWTGRRDTQAKEIFCLEISKSSTSVMPVGVPLNSDQNSPQYLLPFTDFEGHREHTHAQCVRIAVDSRSTLVIPCMELIRFYFGASGSFLKRLFSGAFALDRLYSDARMNQKSRIANITLAPDLSGVAAATVARIAFCSQARSAASWIVNSGIATAANRHNYYPKTTFPFFGKTELTARGRWITHGDSRTFLAEQLSRCTHPFPFDSLYYSTTRSLVMPSAVIKESVPSAATMNASQSNRLEPTIHLTGAPVSSTLQDMGVLVDDESDLCFPDLANKRINRVGKSTQAVSTANSKASQEELGAGFETSSSTQRGVELAIDLDEIALDGVPLPDAAEMFERAVSANSAARDGYMTWRSITDQKTGLGKGNETFSRGDTIIKDNHDQQLKNIWAGVIQLRFDPIVLPVLVLVRDNIVEDADDHILLVRLDPSNLNQEISKYCLLFAAHEQPEAYLANILDMIGSQRSLDLFSILRRLSTIAPDLLRLNSYVPDTQNKG